MTKELMNPSLSMSINSFSIVHYEFGDDEQGDIFCVYKKHRIIIYKRIYFCVKDTIYIDLLYLHLYYIEIQAEMGKGLTSK